MSSYGRATHWTTCRTCGAEDVEFSYWWDHANGGSIGYEDTEHQAPDGTRCDLTDADCERAISGYDPREDRADVP